MHKLSCWSLWTLLKSVELNWNPLIESYADWMNLKFEIGVEKFPDFCLVINLLLTRSHGLASVERRFS